MDTNEPDSSMTVEGNNTSPSSNGEVNPVAEPDTFEALKTLRISQMFMTGAAQKLVTSYTVRKPKKSAFFRVHPGEDYQYEAYVYTEKDEGGLEKETYLVDTSFALQLEPSILSVFRAVQLHLAIERHAEKPFVWPIGFPVGDAKDNEYWRTARACAETAKTKWIRIEAKGGCYDHYESRDPLAEPVWPKTPFVEILRVAFKTRVIADRDHRIIKDLLGEV